MNESAHESMSALMDGEASELDLRRVLAGLDEDSELADRWGRYHLARDALHARAVVHAQADGLADAVAAAIRAPAPAEFPDAAARGRARALPRRWQSAASFAVAASLTAAVMLGARQLEWSGDADPAVPAAAPFGLVSGQGGVPVRASYGSAASTAVVTGSPLQPQAATTDYREIALQRLLRYSEQHAERAVLNTPQGLIPYARVPAEVAAEVPAQIAPGAVEGRE